MVVGAGCFIFFFQAEDGIRVRDVTGVQTCALPISSANPEPIPAPCSTSTLCPSPTSDSTPAGTNATRFSAVFISLGTPTIMRAPLYVFARRLGATSLCYASVLRLRVTFSVFPEPNHRLSFRSEELCRHIRDLFFGEPGDSPENLVQALVRLAVDRKGGQTIHPRGRTLQGQHQLALRLLLRLGERLSREPRARQLAILLADRRCGLRRRLGLGADVHTGHADLAIEAGESVDRIRQTQLLPDA